MTSIIAIIISYLIGAVSFSYVIGKRFKQLDIRDHGSGNAGATNTLRVMGMVPAVTVLLLDCGKGILAVWIGFWLSGGNPVIASSCGFASIIGHNWPVYYGFRGGKGVATTIGVFATLVFLPALISGIIAILSIIISRFVSLGSLLFMLGTTVITVLSYNYFEYPFYFVYFLLVITGLSFWRHRSNIIRLLKGEESKLGQTSPVK